MRILCEISGFLMNVAFFSFYNMIENAIKSAQFVIDY